MKNIPKTKRKVSIAEQLRGWQTEERISRASLRTISR